MTTLKRSDQILHIIVPVFNEAENFPALYKEIKKEVKAPHELIVVYDFDEDSTVPVVKEFQGNDQKLVLRKNTIGPGPLNAILSGFEYVKSGPILVTMADLSDDLSMVDKMFSEYQNGAVIVCGSRYMKGGKQIGGPLLKRTLSRSAGVSLYWLRHFPTHDITNNFKLYEKAFLDVITIESKGGFEIGMELTAKGFKQKVRIVEVPTTWYDRTAGKSNFKLWKWLPSYLSWYFYVLF